MSGRLCFPASGLRYSYVGKFVRDFVLGISRKIEGREWIEGHTQIGRSLAAVDDQLNDVGYIVPGLGDAGDRMFVTK